MYERYFDAVDGILRKVREANRESIPRAASLMADTIAANGIIHAFGSGHSQLLAIELAGVDIRHAALSPHSPQRRSEALFGGYR